MPQGGEHTERDYFEGEEDIMSQSDDEVEAEEVRREKTVKFVNYLRMYNSLPLGVNYVDVLCVNCYECVKANEVNQHSLKCEKPEVEKPSPEHIEKSLVELNDRVFKLIKSINGRFKEV